MRRGPPYPPRSQLAVEEVERQIASRPGDGRFPVSGGRSTVATSKSAGDHEGPEHRSNEIVASRDHPGSLNPRVGRVAR